MIYRTNQMPYLLKDYSNLNAKISRMMKKGELFQLKKGLYEDDGSTPPYLLANSIYSPSYLSFEYALSYWGLIPEYVPVLTSASYKKNRSKTYENKFGVFTYQDVPEAAYPFGVQFIDCGKRGFFIATAKKAILDTLYKKPKLTTVQDMEDWLFDDMRFDEEIFFGLDFSEDFHMKNLYRSGNVSLFFRYLDSKIYKERKQLWTE